MATIIHNHADACHARSITLFFFTTVTDPEDYAGVTTVISFAPGETVKIVNVNTVNDSSSESTESFTATLSNASPPNAINITQPTATVNIADNDCEHLTKSVCMWWVYSILEK